MSDNRLFGAFGEKKAATYMLARGCKILDRNWRHGHLEIDLICLDKETVVFLEVKTRRSLACGGPLGAVSRQKMANMGKAAQAWLMEKDYWRYPCRFDVICLVGSLSSLRLEHYPDAFPYVQPVDSFYANW